MDVIIPNHNLKLFQSSITTLSRVGNYLYIEFDPLDGLTLRTLNDAKSAYAYFHFNVDFFTRCTIPPSYVSSAASSSSSRKRKKRKHHQHPVNSTATRKGRRWKRRMASLKPTNNHQDSDDNDNDNDETQNQSLDYDDDHNDDDDDNDDNTDSNKMMDEKYICRVLIKTVTTILRSRKGVTSLRIKSVGDNTLPQSTTQEEQSQTNETNEDNGQPPPQQQLNMQLSFEYHISSPSSGIMRIIHKIGVMDANSVAAMAPKDECSEIVVSPKVLLNMLEPLKNTNEVALILNDEDKILAATSFHHTDANASTNNSLLNASIPLHLKTETHINCHEFDMYDFIDNREIENDDDIPPDVNNLVTLVFGIKETKAMLQFCSQSCIDEELQAIVSFHWGGRPVTIETEGDTFQAELILATVDHKLLQGVNLIGKQRKTTN